MDDNPGQNPNIRKLAEMIKDIEVAMMTTVDKDGIFHSRPMLTPHREFDGDLWFFTYSSATKVFEIQHNHQVNLSYANPEQMYFVSISGIAEYIHNPHKVKELWRPGYQMWFPQGMETPELDLICVHVNHVEYWDAPSGKMVKIAGFVRLAVSAEKYQDQRDPKIDVNRVVNG